MKYSIISVSRNNLAGLQATYASLPATGADVEWVVIDAASTDGTGAWLSALELPSFTFVSEPDGGIFDGMNEGIRLAAGEYLIFMNAGDRFVDKALFEKLDALLQANRPALIFGDSYEFDAHGTFLKRARPPRYNAYSLFTHHQSILYRADAIAAGYDTSYKIGADWALTARVLRDPRTICMRYPGAICYFERGGVSQSPHRRGEINREHMRICLTEAGVPRFVGYGLYYAKRFANLAHDRQPRLYDAVRFR